MRPLCGADEESVDSTDTASAIALIDRLLLRVPGASYGPGDAATLVAADRDRVLASVYIREAGRHVKSSTICAGCSVRFDIDFDFAAIVAALVPGPDAPRRDADGAFVTASGVKFRLPTGEDELVAAGHASPVDALIARCHLAGRCDVAALEVSMEEAAPLVEFELETSCPECSRHQELRFDIQSFMLGWLLAERRHRLFEQHVLARTLRWSLTEILSLTRAQRRAHAELADRG